MGERGQRIAAGLHQPHRARALACRHRRLWVDHRLCAIKTNIADSINVVIQIERRPGPRFISEVLEISSYDPDTDLFGFSAIYVAPREQS